MPWPYGYPWPYMPQMAAPVVQQRRSNIFTPPGRMKHRMVLLAGEISAFKKLSDDSGDDFGPNSSCLHVPGPSLAPEAAPTIPTLHAVLTGLWRLAALRDARRCADADPTWRLAAAERPVPGASLGASRCPQLSCGEAIWMACCDADPTRQRSRSAPGAS